MRSALFSSPLVPLRSSALALIGLAVLGTGLSTTSAQAGPITYTFSGVGSGTVDGTAFSSTAFTFSVTTDTSTISTARFGAGTPSTAPTMAAVSLAGFGAGTSLDLSGVFDSSVVSATNGSSG